MPTILPTVDFRSVNAVVFDFFGTLTATVSPSLRLETYAPLAQSMSVEPSQLLAALDSGFADRVTGAWGSTPLATLTELSHQLGLVLDEADKQKLVSQRLEIQRKLSQHRTGALEVVHRLAMAGFRLGLVSDCSADLPVLWQEDPLAPHFQSTVFSLHHGVRKPDPALFRAVLSGLEAEPHRCVFVDDNPENLLGARSVGMTTLWFDNGTFESPDLPSRHSRIASLETLCSLLTP